MPRRLPLLAVVTTLACLTPIAAPAGAQTPATTATPIKLWFTGGEQFSVVDRTIQTYRTKALPTVNALLRGPTAAEKAKNIATQIPAGVTVSKLTINGTAAVIELSPTFLKGIPADAAQRTDAQDIVLNARLGQVVYTLTQFPEIKSAKVSSGGQLLSLESPKTQQATTAGTLGRGDFTKPAKATPAPAPTEPTPPAGGKTPAATTKDLQQRLAELGYLPASAVDGVAGYQTQQAVMAFQAWEGLGRDGVAGPLTKARLANASRPKARSGGAAHRIEVYRAKGVALLVDGGKVVRAIHVSSGGPATQTPSGTYKVFRKELRSWSVPFSVYLPYASYFNNGIAFHEYADVPAYPASHGCVRVPAPEAKGVYAFASMGTTVVVI